MKGHRMNVAGQIILNCIKEAGISQIELARRTGQDRRNINQMIHRGTDIKYGKFSEMIESAGYDMQLVKTDTIRVHPYLLITIANAGEPKGKYWCKTGSAYAGVINEDKGSLKRRFENKEDLIRWFKDNGEKSSKM